MNYFELLGLAPLIEVDENLLKKSFYRLSREFHPDMHTRSDQDSQDESMLKSTEVNQAYRTLKDRDKRLNYILKELGGMELNEGASLDPMFLMEMMDLNEKAEEIRDPHERNDLKAEIDSRDRESYTALEDLKSKVINEFTSSDWDQLKKYYLERRYLLRLVKNFE